MTQLKKQVNIYELNGRKHLSLVLGFCVIVLALVYLYLINARIYEGYVMTQTFSALGEKRAGLQSLESDYLAKVGDTGVESSAHLGFVQGEAKFLRVSSGMAMADVFVR
jgi:hypothetical protein